MRKPMAVVSIVAVRVSMGGNAFAGEVNGKGGTTGAPSNANSICAFSGLEDGSEGTPGGPGNPPQNWGQIPKEVRGFSLPSGSPPVRPATAARTRSRAEKPTELLEALATAGASSAKPRKQDGGSFLAP